MIQTQVPGPREADGSCFSGWNCKGRVLDFFLNIVSSILAYKYFLSLWACFVCVHSTIIALSEVSFLGISELKLKIKSRQPLGR